MMDSTRRSVQVPFSDSDLFTLLHTNDFHNSPSTQQLEGLRAKRQALGASGLLLDAGDAVGAGNVTFRPDGEPILTVMSEAGYDAMTVGNREFHISAYGFRSKLSRARFPVLCANIRPTRTPLPDSAPAESLLPVRAYQIIEAAPGWRIAVFGLTVPMVTEQMLVRRFSAYVFDDPIQTARQLVPKLRAQYAPDLVIALTHIGLPQDRRLAGAVAGIDVIIGGHSHDVLERGEWVGRTLVTQTGSHGRSYGRIEVRRGLGEAAGRLEIRAEVEAL